MANRRNFYFGQAVAESELDDAFAQLEAAEQVMASDFVPSGTAPGIVQGLAVAAVTPSANSNVTIAAGAAYDAQGQRCGVNAQQTLGCLNEGTTEIGSTTILTPGATTNVSGGGNEKWLSIFIEFDRKESDQRTDGLSNPVNWKRDESFRFLITQGQEAVAGTAVPPPLQVGAVLLIDVKRTFSDGGIITSGALSTARREEQFNLAGTPQSLQKRTVREAVQVLLGYYNAHVLATLDRHTGAMVDIAASAAWPDSTANNADTLQARIDKLITDLSSVTSQDGAGRIGAYGITGTPNSLLVGTVKTQLTDLLVALNAHISSASGAHASSGITYAGNSHGWADLVAHANNTVEGELDKIVEDLGGTGGGTFVGAAAYGSAPYALTAGSVKSQINQLRDFLAALVAGQISYAGSGTWFDGSVVSAGTLEAAIDEVVSDLAAATGAAKIGAAAGPTWLDTNFDPAGSVQSRIDAIINDLKAVVVPTGAGKIGNDAYNPAGAYDLTAGSVRDQLRELLVHINTLSTAPPAAHTHPGGDITSAVANSNALGGVAPSGYALSGHNHDGVYGKLAVSNGSFGAPAWLGDNFWAGYHYFEISGVKMQVGGNVVRTYSNDNLRLGANNNFYWELEAAVGDLTPEVATGGSSPFIGSQTNRVGHIHTSRVTTSGEQIHHNAAEAQIVPYSVGGARASDTDVVFGGASIFRAIFPSAPSTYTPTNFATGNVLGGAAGCIPYPGTGDTGATALIMRRRAFQAYIEASGAVGEMAYWTGYFTVS